MLKHLKSKAIQTQRSLKGNVKFDLLAIRNETELLPVGHACQKKTLLWFRPPGSPLKISQAPAAQFHQTHMAGGSNSVIPLSCF